MEKRVDPAFTKTNQQPAQDPMSTALKNFQQNLIDKSKQAPLPPAPSNAPKTGYENY